MRKGGRKRGRKGGKEKGGRGGDQALPHYAGITMSIVGSF